MKTNWVKTGLLAMVPVLLLAMGSDAAPKRVPGQYGYSNSPYWQVGLLSQQLTIACQRGEFGQRKHYLLSIGYVGKQGRGITGIATSTWNLHDPKGLAEPRRTYHFFNQGYSNCKVYVAETPRSRNQVPGQ